MEYFEEALIESAQKFIVNQSFRIFKTLKKNKKSSWFDLGSNFDLCIGGDFINIESVDVSEPYVFMYPKIDGKTQLNSYIPIPITEEIVKSIKSHRNKPRKFKLLYQRIEYKETYIDVIADNIKDAEEKGIVELEDFDWGDVSIDDSDVSLLTVVDMDEI